MHEHQTMHEHTLYCPICHTFQGVDVEVPTLYLACGHGMYLYTETGITVIGATVRRLQKGWLWWDAHDMEHMESVQRHLLTKPVKTWDPPSVTLRCVCGAAVDACAPIVADDAPPNERAAAPRVWNWTCVVCGAEGSVTKPGHDALAWTPVETALAVADALYAERQSHYETAYAALPYVKGPQPCDVPLGGLEIVAARRDEYGRWPE